MADKADILATPRNINGVAFDGSEPITITAKANGGRADTADTADNAINFGGKGVNYWTQGRIADITIFEDSNNMFPYISDVSGVNLGNQSWAHVFYSPHRNSNGYGSQIALPFASTRVFVRGSNGTAWTGWQELTQGRKHVSTGNPSGGTDGDFWLKY